MALFRKASLPAPAQIGAAAALLRPLGGALALLVVGVPAIFAWNIYSASEARRAQHEAHVADSATTLSTTIRRKVAGDELEIMLREADGGLSRAIVPRAEGERFANETRAALRQARQETARQAGRDLDRLFAAAFASRAEDIGAYADWFFEWGRSWRLLYEALTGAIQETARLGFSRTQVSDAARHSVEAYLLRHYSEFVLKPGIRDPIIAEGVRQILRDANRSYFAAVARLDTDIRAFLSKETIFRERIDPGTVTLKLDWDAEKWRAPRQFAVDRHLEPARTAILVGGGALAVGPLVQKAAAPMLARLGGRVLMSTRMAVGGASVGSVQPGIGTLVGALGGLAIDWGLNEFQERLERDDFLAANGRALDSTILAWKAAIMPAIGEGIDVWFDDSEAMIGGWARSTGR